MTDKRTTDERLAEAITLLDEATAGDWNLYFDDHSWDDDGRDDWMIARSRSGPVTKGVVAEIKGCKEGDAMLLSRAKSLVLLARDLAGERDAARAGTTDRAATTDRAGADDGGGGEVWDEATFKRLFEEGQELRAAFERQVAGMRR